MSQDSNGLRTLYESEEEHWRHQFYELLQPVSPRGTGSQASFFQADQALHRSEIDERSIRVVYEFSDWPADRADSIDSVPRYTRDELEAMGIGMVGVRNYVLSKPRFLQPGGEVL